MHERFFFPAELLALGVAFAAPRYWSAAALLQIGGLLAYTGYLGGILQAPLLAVVPTSLGLAVLLVAIAEATRKGPIAGRREM